MTRSRANGEGSNYPFRNGLAAYAWVETPAGLRQRKYVYGKTREGVHEKWLPPSVQARVLAGHRDPLLYFAAVLDAQRPPPAWGRGL